MDCFVVFASLKLPRNDEKYARFCVQILRILRKILRFLCESQNLIKQYKKRRI
ncbi:hypothetical protein ACWIUD_01455 [Helicobacter sp. 23-1044]